MPALRHAAQQGAEGRQAVREGVAVDASGRTEGKERCIASGECVREGAAREVWREGRDGGSTMHSKSKREKIKKS
jgi:hypothetical protein